ncbi:MAG: hypothetical protein HY587_07940 [Candidatus Omnitrophica bacterium]|nr:hypothetical protein [Candidatus Omnitrophota bacterium]
MKAKFSRARFLKKTISIFFVPLFICTIFQSQSHGESGISTASKTSQVDLAAMKKYLTKIEEHIDKIRQMQDQIRKEIDTVRIRIRKAGKGSS